MALIRGEAARRTGLAVAAAAVVLGSLALPGAVSHAQTTTFTATADAYVQDSAPTTSFGTSLELGVDAAPVKRVFLAFTVSGLTEQVVSARLRVHTRSTSGAASSTGGTYHAMSSTTWTEAVTWSTQPAIDGVVLGSLGRVGSSSWYEVDVTPHVTGNGTFSIGVTSPSKDGADFDSRESGVNAPHMVVSTGVTPAPTPTLPPTASPSVSPTASPSVSPTPSPSPSPTPSPSPSPTASPSAGGGSTTTVTPFADTYVLSTAPTSAFGGSHEIGVDAAPAKRAFLAFSVRGLTEPVLSAVLRLHTRSTGGAASPYGGRVSAMSSTTWPETSTTWDNQPVIDGPVLGTLGPVTGGTWYQLDVTPLVSGNGDVGIGMTSTSGDGADYDSRESGAHAPQLVVTTGTPPSPTATPAPVAAVLVGAGDIASCGHTGDEATADLLDAIPGRVVTFGDNAYGNGSDAEFANCYHPSWGRHKERTHPALGNHDYGTPGASGYFGYFGAAAGEPGKGYYSYDVAGWHVVVLNSQCAVVACAAGSDQEQWLRADLAAHAARCTAAYWHHPLFTSGSVHDPDVRVRPLYQALYDLGADLVMTGHNHQYERFAPMDPQGNLDRARGLREFVVGTGGAGLYGFGTAQPNSEVRNGTTHGVLKLSLHAASYDWEFVPVAGGLFTDRGTAECH